MKVAAIIGGIAVALVLVYGTLVAPLIGQGQQASNTISKILNP